ncbi:asparaginase [Pseudarthrobacter sp. J75]|uniref:asparaginase n=1 Tax=unclassified Pseudarthrobacter TaxID=2647000 RepID=UPI002E8240E2|nr:MULTISPECIES: asparaginase [unclassified Pseudarthrobacter]MEE2524593.1 asparaginase [Pseudarthrobacter sp. J47]MEE2530110.1 asparaginase [Pseudarthrobacter sp. J75]MEE2570396.1 asparaginase [Pseudarthrobacter sp. J64]
MPSPAPAVLPARPNQQLPQHAPLAVAVRDGLAESIHYGSVIATDHDGGTLLAAGDPFAPFYPRSSLKPLQAVAMVRAGLDLPADLLALTAASHSGSAAHINGSRRILELHGLTPDALENSLDLPYGVAEREEWLRNGGPATRLTQNCSGKHASMAATCVINGWPVKGYLDPGHPLQQLVAVTVAELTGEQSSTVSTDGCGTPLFALTLRGMATAFGTIAKAAADAGTATDGAAPGPEAAVGLAMSRHPEMVAGERRDVTELMRLAPGFVAKDGFEGVQLVGLPDGRAVAVKISDGGDRARMPVTVRALEALDVDTSVLAPIATVAVLGGGRNVGTFQALDFLSTPVNEAR